MKKIAMLLVLVLALGGCVHLGKYDKAEYEQIKRRYESVGMEVEKTKDPVLAGVLNILPGIGNAYIGQWGKFIVNFLFYPLSPVWAIPQAAVDASTMNIMDTLHVYRHQGGKDKLEKLETSK